MRRQRAFLVKGGTMSFDTIFWLIVMIAAGGIELATTALVSIWFVAGAAAAFLLSFFPVSVFVQWLSFAIVSLLVLYLFRGKIAEKMKKRHVATNADAVIGKVLPVKETIDNEKGTGLLVFGDLEWSARTETDGLSLEAGVPVRVVRIEGVKLIVEPAETEIKPESEGAGAENGRAAGN